MPTREGAEGLDGLITESRRANGDYGSLSTQELVELMNAEDASVPAAVGAVAEELAVAVDAIAERLATGGRLHYVGAGSSGAIAALDADECGATFSTAPGQVVALVAGAGLSGAEREAAEDDGDAGKRAVEELGVNERDAVVGISASGRTPYVLGAVDAAAAAGAVTVAVVSTPDSPLAQAAEHEVAVVVGPEVISGSTRLKAGTAQKLVLNTISTLAMIRLGKTFGDLMVDVRASNEKLEARARRVVREAAGVSDDEAREALAAADGSAKVAVVSLLAELDPDAARVRLEQAGGNIDAALRP
ncbi:MAG TPA: N-acetylmuramic acid 6-phosphate etherase [Gaiellaceae bacterium]|jgi:N-acetylmuramic acid 6-phosphate etherase|nr:N-acetylmuramic acid 6-phosphate etherase [Gaiellaceae bacterium]